MRKILISFLTVLLITISFLSPQKSEAAAPIISRVVGGTVGERVLIGIAEKAGIKYTTKKASQEAIERWNLKVYEKIREAEKFGRDTEAEDLRRLQQWVKSREVKNLDTVAEGSKNPVGVFGKVMVDTTLFLLGIDIFMDMRQEYIDAVNNNTMLEKVTEYEELLEEGEAFTSFGPYKFYQLDFPHDDRSQLWIGAYGAEQVTMMPNFNLETVNTSNPSWTGVLTQALVQENGIAISFEYTFKEYNGDNIYTKEKTLLFPKLSDLVYPNGDIVPDYNKVNFLPTPSDIPSSPSVPWVQPWKDNPDEVKPVLPDAIPVEVPLQDPDIYNPEKPWNDPLPTYDPVPGDQPDKDYIPGIPSNPNPDPGTNPNPDTGGDTNPDPGGDTNPDPGGETNPDPGGETNPNPDPGTGNPGTPGTETPPDIPGGPPTPTDPLSWIWIFLKFLFAVIHFILRLGQFILTIPFIPQQQFPGVYGEMVKTFMNLEYGNIHPYRIMISVVNLAFGFVVYKILRRVFNG